MQHSYLRDNMVWFLAETENNTGQCISLILRVFTTVRIILSDSVSLLQCCQSAPPRLIKGQATVSSEREQIRLLIICIQYSQIFTNLVYVQILRFSD